jgi:hypothetical protein
MKRFVIVFDNEPAEPASWIAQACAANALFLVDNEAIATQLAASQEAQQLFLESNLPPGENPQLAPFYTAALDTLAGTRQRIALYGVSWLLYLQGAEGCVLDFAGIEAERQRGVAGGASATQAADSVARYSAHLQDVARRVLPEERILVVPFAESDARKAELASDFIRKLG